MMWDSPVENVMGTTVFLLTEFRVEPSNNRSSSAVGRSINCSLFCFANASSIKQCDDPESNNATNGWAILATVAEVRERRKELGDGSGIQPYDQCRAAIFRATFQERHARKVATQFPEFDSDGLGICRSAACLQHAEGQSHAECPSFPHVAQRLPPYCWTHLSYLSHASGVQFRACVVFGGGHWVVGQNAVVHSTCHSQ